MYNMPMNMNTREGKRAFQKAFLRKAGPNFEAVKQMMDTLSDVGFYIKDTNDRIVTLNFRNCEISALKDEFDAIGRKSSDLFPEPIARECLRRDAAVRRTRKPLVRKFNYATVDRDPSPTIYSVYPLFDARKRLIGTMCGFFTYAKGTSTPPPRLRLQPALDWMRAHVCERVSLDLLAEKCGMSVTHFRRLFAETFRETPSKYALRIRLDHARDLLEKSTRTIVDIALECGFYDQSHFVKAFRRVHKINPDSYRRRHRRLAK